MSHCFYQISQSRDSQNFFLLPSTSQLSKNLDCKHHIPSNTIKIHKQTKNTHSRHHVTVTSKYHLQMIQMILPWFFMNQLPYIFQTNLVEQPGLECTELPPYADALRAETKLPVFDAITNAELGRDKGWTVWTVRCGWNSLESWVLSVCFLRVFTCLYWMILDGNLEGWRLGECGKNMCFLSISMPRISSSLHDATILASVAWLV